MAQILPHRSFLNNVIQSLLVHICWTTASIHHIFFPVLISSRRNLFILNKFLISGKILISCSELYFEVVGDVYLIKMGNFPENDLFSVKDHVQNDTC